MAEKNHKIIYEKNGWNQPIDKKVVVEINQIFNKSWERIFRAYYADSSDNANDSGWYPAV